MPGSLIVAELIAGGYIVAGGVAAYATAFAINMVASSIIAKSFGPDSNQNFSGSQQNPGSRSQISPNGANKVPVIYGSAYTGGIVTDLSITSDNQQLYYVLTLAECTNTETGGTPDTYTFGDVYFGGKKCIFDPTDRYKVTGLLDESTGLTETTVNGKLEIYLYSNGSNAPANSLVSAISLMSDINLVYQWDSTKLMTNAAFAIVKITYSQSANLTSIQQTKFQITNSRYKPGDCFLDYLTSERYGAAIPLANIDTASLNLLNAYSNGLYTYTTYLGATTTQARFRFDGQLDTSQSIMTNLQIMATCCDCLLKYNEIYGTWGVIVQEPIYTTEINLTDSDIISGIQITPIDIASSFNIAEVKFPDSTSQDSFNTATYDLSVINPSLMYPNEPVNKQSISLPLVNNSVRAQFLANRFLESAREDLQIKLSVNFVGLQYEAGDIVSLTNVNYGWTNKLFRTSQVVENFNSDGSITVSLTLMEYNPAVFDDVNITQFTPSPNTGIGSPLTFGIMYAPVVNNSQPSAATPSFGVLVTASSAGIVQYAEIWYSAYSSPTDSQRIFAGTTVVNPNGSPFDPSLSMGVVTLSNIPSGDWYFSVRMVNSVGSSPFSPSSTVYQWRPTTLQYVERWLAVAYADNITGTSGFSYSPRNKAYYGLYNSPTANGGTNPALYTWYAASSNFGTENYLLYANRTNRKFSFNIGDAGYTNLGGSFVPTETSKYDTSIWSGLLDPTGALQSFIDLDVRTGQLLVAGATGNNQNDGFLSVTNNTDGSMKVNLQDFLNFGAGIYTKSFSAATLTIDIYGRVVGFLEEDQFFYTETVYTATSGQTSFSNTHTVGWIFVFRNGLLLGTSDYTETTSTVVMANACAAGETVVIIYMRGVSTSNAYINTNITIASSTTNTVTYSSSPWQNILAGDVLTFANTGSPTGYTVSSVNRTTKVITFTTSISGATAELPIYLYRSAGSNYAPFSRYNFSVNAITSLDTGAFGIGIQNGAESIYMNGSQINEIDYNISGNVINGFPAAVTGSFTIIMYAPNNLNVPASNIANTTAYSTAGQTTYPFPSNPLSMEIYANGALLTKGSGYDYTASSVNFILATAYDNNSTLFNQQTFARIGAA
jgi:hypothetical protein